MDRRKRIVADGYDRMAARYLEWGEGIAEDPRTEFVARLARELPPDAHVLELGCGAGIPSTRELARRFRVVGVDISAAQIELARRNVPSATFVNADFTECTFEEGTFNGVVALHAVVHVPRDQHARLFADVFRWLAPGGLFGATLSAVDSPDWVGTWLGEEMFFSGFDADTNRQMLRSVGFELLLDDVLLTAEPDADVRFLWAIARKPSEARPSGVDLPNRERLSDDA